MPNRRGPVGYSHVRRPVSTRYVLCTDTASVCVRARYPFSPSGVYRVPEVETYDGYVEYLRSLPLIAHPEVFGLHENADITKDNKETNMVREVPAQAPWIPAPRRIAKRVHSRI